MRPLFWSPRKRFPPLRPPLPGSSCSPCRFIKIQTSCEPATVDAVNLDLVGAFVDVHRRQIPQICRVGIAQILGKPRRRSRDSAQIKPENASSLRQKEIPNASKSGAVLLPNQRVPAHCHSLRQTGQNLHGFRPSRLRFRRFSIHLKMLDKARKQVN